MFSAIKEAILFCFSFSLVAAYFESFGYYSYFGIDITSYLSVQDLTLMFAIFVWLPIAFIFIAFYAMKDCFNWLDKIGGWWARTVGKTCLKRKAVPILTCIITLVVIAVIYSNVRQFMLDVFGLAVSGGILAILLGVGFSVFEGKTDLKQFNLKEWFVIIAVSIVVFVAAPALGGLIAAKNLKPKNTSILFLSGTLLNTQQSGGIVFIGKTHDYFFVYDRNSKISTAYRMDKVVSFSVVR